MYVAKHDICEKLYKLSGWEPENCHWWYLHNDIMREADAKPEGQQWDNNRYWPLYDLGYLLRKLPKRTDRIEDTVMLGRSSDNTAWSIVYQDFVFISDTPEDAAAKLAIALIENEL